jgi:hypothetical protein
VAFESDGADSVAAQDAMRRSRTGMYGHCPQMQGGFHAFPPFFFMERSFGLQRWRACG